jgi:hypothetical protein
MRGELLTFAEGKPQTLRSGSSSLPCIGKMVRFGKVLLRLFDSGFIASVATGT